MNYNNFGLIKISGAYFQDKEEELMNFLNKNRDKKLVFMVGGGNITRGRYVESKDRLLKDRMGILSTLINGVSLGEKMLSLSLNPYICAPICNEDVINPYNPMKIKELMQKNTHKIIVCGGLGWSGNISTDTAMVVRGLELSCSWVCKISEIGGVFEEDPNINPEAKLLNYLDYDQALKYDAYDKSAALIAKENNLPLVFAKLDNLSKMISDLENGKFNSINSTIIKNLI
ncbi:hypothetical protein FZC35_02375 [Candidatus Cytomitobacter indipagum]|uniref:UMP kinase n=1 Tax=Candidatus Cytomitobacter indipagum TaxID=2601575 RepID=A0A5C0UES0_9PROT|nr:hypothetical protein [Candidatus Cytomitobacter indipagum]QEK38200.1 hypothetical protein FZC35_02375 [Candidatus Cytomitobacter indipagum]